MACLDTSVGTNGCLANVNTTCQFVTHTAQCRMGALQHAATVLLLSPPLRARAQRLTTSASPLPLCMASCCLGLPQLCCAPVSAGAVQVRNGASLGGNIMTASPISDINAIMMAAGASYEAVKLGGSRSIAPQDFVVDRR